MSPEHKELRQWIIGCYVAALVVILLLFVLSGKAPAVTTDTLDISYSYDFPSLTVSGEELLAPAYTNPNTWRFDDSIIRHLASSGRICEVLGHRCPAIWYGIGDTKEDSE